MAALNGKSVPINGDTPLEVLVMIKKISLQVLSANYVWVISVGKVVNLFGSVAMSNRSISLLNALNEKSHGGDIENADGFINITDSKIFKGEKTVHLKGEFCGSELRALVDLMGGE